jgi:hypothetical protein
MYPLAVKPHYEGMDPYNEDQMYLQYLYTVRPNEIERALSDAGYKMNTANDVLWSLQREMQGNEPFVRWLFTLDPMHDSHAEIFIDNNEESSQLVLHRNGNSVEAPNKETCSKDDILCLIRETKREIEDAFSLKLKMPQLILIGMGLLAFILIYNNQKA